MAIWYEIKEALKNKIMEERRKYILQFKEEPKYVVIPIYYGCFLETDNEYIINLANDTYYGMQVIESNKCKLIGDTRVY